MASRYFLTAGGVYLVAFIVRLIFLNQFQSMPGFDLPKMDEHYHLQLAAMINSAAGMLPEPYFRAPLYFYFLAKLLLISGGSLYWARLLQILLASIVPVLVLGLGRRLIGDRPALVAAIICALYPTLIIFDNSFLIESITGLAILLLCGQLYRSQGKPTIPNFALSGFLLGIVGLLRPNILPFGVALFFWVWFVIRRKLGSRRTLINYAVMGVVTFATILPVTIRNYVVGNDKVFIAWQGGFNFYLGNNHAANGWSAGAPGMDLSWQGSYDEAIKIAERDAGHALKRSEVSDYWYRRAFNEIAADPARFMELTFTKLRLFFNGEEIPNNQSTYLVREFAPIIRPLLFTDPVYFPYGILAPLAIVGMILLLPRWREFLIIYLLIASYVGTLLLFFICDRYRQPLMPLLILMAVGGVGQLFDLLKKRRLRPLAVCLVMLLLLAFESNHSLTGIPANFREAEDRYGLGCTYLDKGDLPDAEREFKLSVQADPLHSLSYLNLGNIRRQKNDLQAALGYYLRAVAADSTLWQGYLSAAAAYKHLGMQPQAMQTLLKARVMAPDNEFVHLELALAYFEAKDFANAKTSITEAMRLNPRDVQIKQTYNSIMAISDKL